MSRPLPASMVRVKDIEIGKSVWCNEGALTYLPKDDFPDPLPSRFIISPTYALHKGFNQFSHQYRLTRVGEKTLEVEPSRKFDIAKCRRLGKDAHTNWRLENYFWVNKLQPSRGQWVPIFDNRFPPIYYLAYAYDQLVNGDNVFVTEQQIWHIPELGRYFVRTDTIFYRGPTANVPVIIITKYQNKLLAEFFGQIDPQKFVRAKPSWADAPAAVELSILV